MLTPAQSDEDEHHKSWDLLDGRSHNPSTNTGGLTESAEDDLVMLDSLPVHSPAGAGLVSPYMMSNRIPTPRYGSFFLRPPSQQGGSDVAMGDMEDALRRSIGLESREVVVENRMLPSPISEGDHWRRHMLSPIQGADEMMGRWAMETEEQDGKIEMEIPEKAGTGQAHHPGRSRVEYGTGRGKPMLVMGYRADCEKCRARVPGHYSHVVRS